MQHWLERERSAVPKRAIKRASSDLPPLDDAESQGDYLRQLLAGDPSLRWRQLREAIKAKGFLVSERTMRNWFERYDGKCTRARLEAPIDGLPCVDRTGLQAYEAELLQEWNS